MKWLEGQGLDFEEVAIKEVQPNDEELAQMLGHQEGQLRKLFNTSGMDYRALGLKEQLPTMGEKEAFALLQTNGMLVKRPFLLGDGVGLLGFKEKEWVEKLG